MSRKWSRRSPTWAEFTLEEEEADWEEHLMAIDDIDTDGEAEAMELQKAVALSVFSEARVEDTDRELMEAIALSLAEHDRAEECCARPGAHSVASACPEPEGAICWEFHDGQPDGGWVAMAMADSESLEAQYRQDPQSQFRAQLGHKQWYYTVDFSCMMQMSERTGMPRALRRVPLRKVPFQAEGRFESDEAFLCGTSGAFPSGRAGVDAAAGAAGNQSTLPARPSAAAVTTPTTCHENSAWVRYTLKAILGLDVRRLRAVWPAGCGPAEALGAIHASLREGFGARLEGTPLLLQYTDNEGDACSLVETTLEDCLLFARDGVLKLIIGPVAGHLACAPEGKPCTAAAASTAAPPHRPFHQAQTFSIASPPLTPRSSASGSQSGSELDEQYSLEWSIVEPAGGPGDAIER
jgi:hypothetical protein